MPAQLLTHDDVLDDGVLIRTLTLSHPEKRGALTRPLLAALVDAIAAAADDDVRALVLVGAGGSFSSGFDLTSLDDHEQARGVDPITDAATAICASAVPVVVAVDGVCYGGAVELACAAAVRVAARTARFCVPAVKLGLVYPAGGLRLFRRTLGRNAERVLLTGAPFSADDARAWGLVHDVVDDARAHAARIAADIARAAPLAVRGTARALAAIDVDDDATVDAVRAAALASADLAEGVAAAQTKRAPKFRGA
jgi:enoyl-CoA hydratase/carnithine racemase